MTIVLRSWEKLAEQYMDSENTDEVQSTLCQRWHYENGCIMKAFLAIWETKKDDRYLTFVSTCIANLVTDSGNIRGYQLEAFNLDNINEGKILFDVFGVTGDERYRIAIETLVRQMEFQPKTSSGGYWHKKIYPNQMWLDGIYMSGPFLARYAATFDCARWFDVVVDQIRLIHKNTWDPVTGLNYHAWDETRQQLWANPVTGCSPHFWGRAIGWFLMAVVDVLEYLPEKHNGREDLKHILYELSNSILTIQNSTTGLWNQVLNQQEDKDNYAEASCSSMFVYGISKGIRMGILPLIWRNNVIKAYEGIINYLIKLDNDGKTVHLTGCNAVAGLGGHPYRDGSLHYYLSEPIVNDDPKAVAAFIMASLEMEKSEYC